VSLRWYTTAEEPCSDAKPIEPLWDALRKVSLLEFTSHSRSNTGWTGRGTGTVTVEAPTVDSLIFHESGLWHSATSKPLAFRNVYRWTRTVEAVRLEHLRFGEKHPVYLFDLSPTTDVEWASIAPHFCREDEYAARLEVNEPRILLTWRITGPEKNEEIAYSYQ
jgi:hypothetical protein